jgi:hypothetical protein
MNLILKNCQVKKEIRIETSKGNPIDNYQIFELSQFEINQFSNYSKEKYPLVTQRNSPSPIYNCHGMSFASRRTNIDSSTEIRNILSDDSYEKINEKVTLAGDLVLYITPDTGDIAHSGTIISTVHDANNISTIFVVSKWGKYKEVIHNINDCPYSNCYKEFYRLTHSNYGN